MEAEESSIPRRISSSTPISPKTPRKKAPCSTRLNGKLRAAKIGLPEKYKRYTRYTDENSQAECGGE
jgi:hypothetical protein